MGHISKYNSYLLSTLLIPIHARRGFTMARVHCLNFLEKINLLCFSYISPPWFLLNYLKETRSISLLPRLLFKTVYKLLKFKPPKVSSEKNLAQADEDRKLKPLPLRSGLLFRFHLKGLDRGQNESDPP